MRWILSACWIAIVALAFVALDASSVRSWVLFATVAVGPPVTLVRLWPERLLQTAHEVIHGHGERS
jgi:hypothetical protein